MKTILKKASAVVITLAVMASSVVFDVPGKMTANGASAAGGCEGDQEHSDTTWTGEAFTKSGSYYLDENIALPSQIEIDNDVEVILCLNGHTITTESNSRIFTVKSGSLTICDCDGNGLITGGAVSENGSSSGGAVYVNSGAAFTLSGGTISGNSAKQGGGVYNAGTFIMNGGAISDNTVKNNGENGGGVYNAGTFEMNGGIISKNSSEKGGGVFEHNGSAEFKMSGGAISDNTASHEGGGVYVSDGGIFTMNSGEISGNTVKYKDDNDNGGGGVYTAGTFKMSGRSTISGNIAGTENEGKYRFGGGVCVSGKNAEFIMSSGTLSGNKANYGGGVYVSSSGTFKMQGGTIGDANEAVSGGGGVGTGGGEFIMSGGTISGNTTPNSGGGVYAFNGKFTMSSGTISDNISKNGGGVFLRSGDFTMSGGAISDNTAKNYGGGVYVENIDGGGTMTLNGLVNIMSNKRSADSESNVYLRTGKTITIGNSFSTAHEIGIHPEKNPSDCKDYIDATVFAENADAKDISDHFKADITGQDIVYKDSGIKLTGEHDYKKTWSNDDEDHWHECVKGNAEKDRAKHIWDDGTVTKEPTCTEQGIITYTCSVCERTKTDKINATGHKYSETWSNDDAEHWHECIKGDAENDKAKHIWDDGTVTKEPTCTEQGIITYTCSVCERTKTGKIDAAGHEYSETWSNDDSEHWHVCIKGDAEKDRAKHIWDNGKVTKEPTCTKPGEKTYTCKECKLTKTEVIAAAGHEYSETWSYDDAEHWHECIKGDAENDRAKHIWDNGTETKKPTCTEPGEKTYTCKECKLTKTEVIAAAGHVYSETWSNDDAEHWHECIKGDAENDRAKHIWDNGTETKKPTCTEPGEKTYTCKECKLTKTEVIAAAGHVYSETWSNDDAEHWHVCVKGDAENDRAKHIWDNGTETKKPTCTEPGVITYTCNVCKLTKTDEIGATGHDYGEWITTTAPSSTETGIETRTCKNDSSHVETRDIPKLNDDNSDNNNNDDDNSDNNSDDNSDNNSDDDNNESNSDDNSDDNNSDDNSNDDNNDNSNDDNNDNSDDNNSDDNNDNSSDDNSDNDNNDNSSDDDNSDNSDDDNNDNSSDDNNNDNSSDDNNNDNSSDDNNSDNSSDDNNDDNSDEDNSDDNNDNSSDDNSDNNSDDDNSDNSDDDNNDNSSDDDNNDDNSDEDNSDDNNDNSSDDNNDNNSDDDNNDNNSDDDNSDNNSDNSDDNDKNSDDDNSNTGNNDDGTTGSNTDNKDSNNGSLGNAAHNPSTGIAVSLIPLAAAIISLTMTIKRNKK